MLIRTLTATVSLAVSLTLLLILGLAWSCQRPSRWAGTKYRDQWRYFKARPDDHARLLAHERALVARPQEYASRRQSRRFYPQGLYYDASTHTVWVYSRAHTEQLGLRATGAFGSTRPTWQLADRRSGPLETRRCQALRTRASTLCLGLMHPGGLRAYGPAPFSSQLPMRGGFRDFAILEERARIYVIDGYLDALWVLDLKGQVLSQTEISAGTYRIGAMGEDRLFLLASNQPRLNVVQLDDAGDVREQIGLHTAAPYRSATFDAESRLLWTVGYRQARVRRNRGYVENLESFAYVYRADDLAMGVPVPVRAVDLSHTRLTDPVAVDIAGDGVILALAGSHQLARLTRRRTTAPDPLTHHSTGLVPNALLAVDGDVFSAGFLTSDVRVHDAADLRTRQVLGLDHGASLSGRRAGRPYELGEMLFYSKELWSERPRNHFTCNSCHWDGLTDHRIHPGFLESRWEQIRPASGAGLLAPVFTPGKTTSLTVAVQGFIKSLDERFWTRPDAPVWFADVKVAIDADETAIRHSELSTFDARRALLTYLARRPVEPGYLRVPGQPLSRSAVRGADLFLRDCASCHPPVARMADRAPLTRPRMLDYLVDRPLAFARAHPLAKTGVEPYFGDAGNRVAPLTQLGRPGPFLSNGSAPTLRAVIRRTDVRADRVHGPENAGQPVYRGADESDLLNFLLSI